MSSPAVSIDVKRTIDTDEKTYSMVTYYHVTIRKGDKVGTLQFRGDISYDDSVFVQDFLDRIRGEAWFKEAIRDEDITTNLGVLGLAIERLEYDEELQELKRDQQKTDLSEEVKKESDAITRESEDSFDNLWKKFK